MYAERASKTDTFIKDLLKVKNKHTRICTLTTPNREIKTRRNGKDDRIISQIGSIV